MKDGFFKVGAASPEISVADCAGNADNIIAVMKKAHEAEVRLLVLPELCVTGATCGDLFFHDTLTASANEALQRIAVASYGYDMLTVVGVPAVKNGRLYSCAAFVLRGETAACVPLKRGSGDRHFACAEKGYIIRCPGIPMLTIGSEGSGASIVIAPYAAAELAGSAEKRLRYAEAFSGTALCAYIAAGAGRGESTTDAVFSGHDIIAENGHILSEAKYSDGIITADLDLGAIAYLRGKEGSEAGAEDIEAIDITLGEKETVLTRSFRRLPFVPDGEKLPARCEEVFSIQCEGLRKRMLHTGAKTLVVGVSGGLDSTLALLVSVKTAQMLRLPASSVTAVTMPCFGTTERTRGNAEKLCSLLGTELLRVDIADSVRRHFADIGHSESDRSVVYENSQARERTQVLMDIANGRNGIVVGTGDLSELALGWATYNGDHMSMYGVNASVPKTLIKAMVRHYAEAFGGELSDVLLDIASTPVSPELLPSEDGSVSQKTEELIGPYELNDFLLYHMLGRGFSPRKLLRAAITAFPEYGTGELKERIKLFCGRFFSQQYKRSCLPDGPQTGSITLSPRGGLVMPSDASAAAWLSGLEEM